MIERTRSESSLVAAGGISMGGDVAVALAGIDPYEEAASWGAVIKGDEALLTALVGRDVCGISIAKTARYFGRDASSMVRGVAKLEDASLHDARLRRRIEAVQTAVRGTRASEHD